MSCMQRRKTVVEAAAAVLALACACGVVHAADLYRWTDADGRVVYGDKPPKNARNVSRIDVDTSTTTVPARPAPAPAAPAAAAAPAPQAADILTQRRATRARLEANVAQARERLDLARKNLAEATDMAPEEQQSIIENVPTESLTPDPNAKAPQGVNPNTANTVETANLTPARGGMYGMSSNRQNCTVTITKEKNKVLVCPTIVPNQAYRERIAMLEDAVKKAEADLDAALDAYRRGVD